MQSRLKELYRHKKFSITQLALILDKSRTSVSEWLHNGRAICLSVDNVESYRKFINELSIDDEKETLLKATQNERI